MVEKPLSDLPSRLPVLSPSEGCEVDKEPRIERMSNSKHPATDVAKSSTTQSQPDHTEFVERSDVGVSLTVQLTRGTGTRDQDKITAKVKAKTLEDARTDMETLQAYIDDLAASTRQIQPAEAIK